MTIWKFPIEIGGLVTITMPRRAEVLSVGVEKPDQVVIWAMVDPAAERTTRTFHVRGTGHDLTGGEGRFIGTFQLPEHAFVGHLFETS
jgi:hypothetical protein